MDQVPMEAPWLLPDTDLPLPMCMLVADPRKYRSFLRLRYEPVPPDQGASARIRAAGS